MTLRDRSLPSPRRESPRALHSGQPVPQYALGRQCAVQDCHARLSRYNPSDTCSLHRGWIDTRSRAPYGG